MKISTQSKLISTALAAVAIAAPVAHGETDGTLLSRASQNPTSVASVSYPQLKTGEGFSFKAPSYWSIARLNTGAPAHATEGFSLGVPLQYLEQPTSTSGGNGFDWADAGIGAAFVAGLGMLGLGGVWAARRRHGIAQLDV